MSGSVIDFGSPPYAAGGGASCAAAAVVASDAASTSLDEGCVVESMLSETSGSTAVA